jgi:hypothetical protein
MVAYFNQDWGDDYESWEDVVAAFAADARATGVEGAVRELDGLLASDATDEDVDWLLREGLGSGFVPSVYGMRPRESLLAIRDELRRQLSEGPGR